MCDWLSEPHLLGPVNAPPAEPYAVLPYGSAIQVTGEENHHEAIAPFLVREGDCWVIATLHRSELGGNRAVKSVTEVRIDGAKVGVLTPKMSSETLPAVDFLAEQGAVAAVRARVKGNRIKGRGRLILLPRPRNIRRLVQQPCQRAERLVAIPRRRGRAGRWQHTPGCRPSGTAASSARRGNRSHSVSPGRPGIAALTRLVPRSQRRGPAAVLERSVVDDACRVDAAFLDRQGDQAGPAALTRISEASGQAPCSQPSQR